MITADREKAHLTYKRAFGQAQVMEAAEKNAQQIQQGENPGATGATLQDRWQEEILPILAENLYAITAMVITRHQIACTKM